MSKAPTSAQNAQLASFMPNSRWKTVPPVRAGGRRREKGRKKHGKIADI
jgi:hypothetical protein